MFDRLRRAWAARVLEWEVKTGRRTWGRQPDDPLHDQSDGSGRIGVRVPVHATISAVVRRGNSGIYGPPGQVEELGVLSAIDTEVDASLLEQMRREAEGDQP